MGDRTHIAVIRDGTVADWNDWRDRNPSLQPDLTRIDLRDRDLRGIDFRGTGLFKAQLSGTNLESALLRQARLVETDLRNARLNNAHVYGASVWDVKLEGAQQQDLILTPPRSVVEVTADNLEVSQFIYLIVRNETLRGAIDAIVKKVVLILGNFAPERKAVLDAIRSALRRANLIPVMFDFVGPEERDLTETISLLARLSRYIVADLTEPRSVPHELAAIVPDLRAPLVSVIHRGDRPYAMFADLQKYPWVEEVIEYGEATDAAEKVLKAIQSAD